MNRRSFLNCLAGVAPAILLPKFGDGFKWKRGPAQQLYQINPAWVDAPYEIVFLMDQGISFRCKATPPLRAEMLPDGRVMVVEPYLNVTRPSMPRFEASSWRKVK